jgi:hypothetical protein
MLSSLPTPTIRDYYPIQHRIIITVINFRLCYVMMNIFELMMLSDDVCHVSNIIKVHLK